MKKKKKEIMKDPRQLKQKLMAAVSMLVVAGVLLSTVTFAWLVMSIAPEVKGVTTNIGANGSLEIALLNSATRQDMNTIPSGVVGSSLANNSTSANYTWGNLIDVSDASYGLDDITLMPSRISATENDDGSGYVVNGGLLSVPEYGFDGRIVKLNNNTISSTYASDKFSYTYGVQDYGVRAIGTASALTAQGSALATAKSNITTYKNSANNAMVNTWNKNGANLFQIFFTHAMASGSDTYTDAELDVIKAMIVDLNSAADYIDLSLRYGLVAFAASNIAEESDFLSARDFIVDPSKSMGDIVAMIGDLGITLPTEFANWTSELSGIESDLASAASACNILEGGTYTWAEISQPLRFIMNTENVYVDDYKFSELKDHSGELMSNPGFTLTLAPDSGAFADIADFAENFNTTFTFSGKALTVQTLSTVSPAYLVALSEATEDLEAAGGATGASIDLTSTFGYALDLAFRCNASGTSKLLLQTSPEQRVYDDSDAASTMGGGSYMEFTTTDESIDFATMIKLLDAVRVGFIDDQSNLLGVAKLNVSNRVIDGDAVKAPLYLYDYSFSTAAENEGAMIMGERQKEDNTLTTLEKNAPKAMTAVVWIDGDLVDNTMVSADRSATLGGTLNLQFSTDANLIPADDSALLELETNKTGLAMALTQSESTYAAGQSDYTTTSWEKFVNAYGYAVSVNEDLDANDIQVKMAVMDLATAYAGLESVSTEALSNRITTIRELMGQKTETAAYYVVYNKDEAKYELVTDALGAKYEGVIERVYNNNNLQDEGNDFKTPIYTEESWDNLAEALYRAELLLNYNYAKTAAAEKEAVLDDMLTALDEAYNALERNVYYVAYDYQGAIYYMAITNKDEVIEDTYGKWYDSEFQRVISDLKILELDAGSTKANIATIQQSAYVARTSVDTALNDNYYFRLNPYVQLKDSYYTELADDEIVAMSWKTYSPNFVNSVTEAEVNYLQTLVDSAKTYSGSESLTKAMEYAESVLNNNYFGSSEAYTFAGVIALMETELEAIEAALPGMTTVQEILLEKAVANALASTKFTEVDDEGGYKYPDLRAATEAAEEILASADDAVRTKDNANDALVNLNAQLTLAGEEEATEFNTIVRSVPVDSNRYEPVYDVTSPTGMLHFKADITATENEEASLTAVILTKNGVVYTTNPVSFEMYTKAKGVEIDDVVDYVAVTPGHTLDLSATLVANEWLTTTTSHIAQSETIYSYSWSISPSHVPGVNFGSYWVDTSYTDEEGVYHETGYTSHIYTWSSANPWIYVDDDAWAGTYTVYLTVTTYEGHSYTDSFELEVVKE